LVILACLVWVAPAPTATATPIITGLNKTGTGYADGAGGPDNSWEVYALPTVYTGTITAPYSAWVFSGGSAQANIPRQWFPGTANGDNVGYNGARWIGLQNNDATALFPGDFPIPPGMSDYNVIYRTTFQADSAGTASFVLRATADNAVSFFVNGSVDIANPYMPTVTGGTQIGSEVQRLSQLSWINGDAPVDAGVNYLYAVVRDRFLPSVNNPLVGSYGQTGLLVAAVPEPSSMVLAAFGGGVMVIGALRRRLKCLA